MTAFQIDLDRETVQLDGVWYTQSALAEKIKTMLEQGDFSVSRPGHALEQLNQALASLKAFQVRLPPEWADKLSQRAEAQGQTVSFLLREALERYLETPSATGTQPELPERVKPRSTVEMQFTAPKMEAPRRLTPRGGPKAALVPEKKKTNEAEDALERGWFGGET